MRSTCAGSVVLAATFFVLAGYQPGGATVEVVFGESGLTVSASDARLEEVLAALASEGDFTVKVRGAAERPPVDVHMQDVTVERALRAVLRGNNYVIGYERRDDGLAVSRVEVMLPRAPETAVADPRATRGTLPVPAVQLRDVQRRRVEAQQRAAEARAAELRAARLEQRRAAQQARTAQQARPARQAEQPAEPQAESIPLRRLLWQRR